MRLRLALCLVALVACKTDPPPASTSSATTNAPTKPTRPPLTCANIQSCVGNCPLGPLLKACADDCLARLTPAARPYYDALQGCVVPSCANADAAGPCLDPGSLGCKMCAMSHCGALASSCLLH